MKSNCTYHLPSKIKQRIEGWIGVWELEKGRLRDRAFWKSSKQKGKG